MRILLRGGSAALALALLSFPALVSAQAQKAASGVALRARVLAVRRASFPEVTLTLEPLPPTTGLPSRVVAKPLFVRSQGRVRNFVHPTNVQGFLAFYLEPGDVVTGRLTGRSPMWTLQGLRREANPPPAVPELTAPRLRVELSTDDSEYSQGEPVRMLLEVTNVGQEPLTLTFASGQRYDFAVRQSGREVWRWSVGRIFTQAASEVRIEAGETVEYRETWDQRNAAGSQVPAGTYEVVGTLTAGGRLGLSQSSAEVQIRARTPVRADPPVPGGITKLDDIAARPNAYLNKEVTVEGLFQGTDGDGRDPLIRGGQPRSRRDWVLEDDTGSIWVNGDGGITLDARQDMGVRLRVNGLVRMTPTRRIYLRAWEVRRLEPQ